MSLTPAKASVLAAATALIFLGLFISAAHAQVLFPARGGTGTSTVPTLGQILMGQANGSWGPQATSTLGLLTTNVAEGSNLYYTDGRVASYLVGSTTLPALLNYWTKSSSDLSYIGGNVGIGLSSPAAKLDVVDAVRASRSGVPATYLEMFGGSGSADPYLNWAGSGTNFRINYAGNALLTILNGGNIGIGTTGPLGKLHVLTATETAPNTIAAFDGRHTVFGPGTADGLAFSKTTGGSAYISSIRPGVAWDPLAIQASTLSFNPVAGATAFHIANGGNVGIGTTAPDAPLSFSSSLGTKINLYDGLTYDIGIQTSLMQFIVPSTGNAIGFGAGSSASFAEWMRVIDGKVGIATTSPSEKLTVSGNALLTGTFPYLSLTPSGWGSTTYIQAGVNQESNASGDYLTTIVPSGKGFAFTQGTLPLVVIDTTGNMGVGTGTGSINGKLDVAGIINVSGVEGSNGLRWSAGDAEITEASYNLIFKTWTGSDLTEKMRVTGEGNIGIGTSNPSSLLQLFSTATTTFSVDSNSATQGSCLELKDSDGSGYSYITVADGAMTVSTTSCK